MSLSEILDVNHESMTPFALKAERTVHLVTFNPSSASPGETLYVNLPKLTNSHIYVCYSTALAFNLTLGMGQANNTLVNNLGRNLIERMRIVYGGEVIMDLNRYDLYHTYSDLFKLVRERDNMLREGVSNLNMRRLRTGAGNKVTTDTAEVTLGTIHSTRYRMRIEHEILDRHGVFNMRALKNNLIFEITLAQSSGIGVTTDNSANYAYSLTNLELEYETILSETLSQDAAASYQVGKGFYYENILLHK